MTPRSHAAETVLDPFKGSVEKGIFETQFDSFGYAIAAGERLETRGVGPLVPISNNLGEEGRSLNRRVEIVQRLGDN